MDDEFVHVDTCLLTWNHLVQIVLMIIGLGDATFYALEEWEDTGFGVTYIQNTFATSNKDLISGESEAVAKKVDYLK